MKATEVTAGLAENNGSLLPGLWRDSLHVICGLTACTPGSAPGPTLGNECGKTSPLSRARPLFPARAASLSVSICTAHDRQHFFASKLEMCGTIMLADAVDFTSASFKISVITHVDIALLVASICGPPAAISCSYRDTGVPCSVVGPFL